MKMLSTAMETSRPETGGKRVKAPQPNVSRAGDLFKIAQDTLRFCREARDWGKVTRLRPPGVEAGKESANP